MGKGLLGFRMKIIGEEVVPTTFAALPQSQLDPFSPISPLLPLFFLKQKREKSLFLGVYLRLRNAMAAATTTITMIAAAIAMYVAVGAPPVGWTAWLGEGEDV
jgi:hypothetical protein